MRESGAGQFMEALNVFGLAGKVAVVTGAGSGIGRATAELFSAVGAKVALLDLDGDAAGRVAAAITGGGETLALKTDVSSNVDVGKAFAEVAEKLGPVNVVVNNAAYRPKAAFMEMSVDEWDRMHAVNTRGVFLCMREGIRQMVASGVGGAVVNVSSVSAVQPTIFNNTHYDSSKAGVDAMTRVTALEFAAAGIRVNSVRPGGTMTEGQQKIVASAKGSKNTGPYTLPGRLPMGRYASPPELARAILFLASPAASYITGQHLSVDGGFSVS